MGLIDAVLDAYLPGGRAERQGARLMREGRRAEGRIVGIDRDDSSDTPERRTLALEVTGSARVGTRVNLPAMERVRLGLTVPLRTADDGRAVIDWPALAQRWGAPAEPVSQRRERSAPEPGVRDTGRDGGVKLRLKRWDPARATVTSMEQRRLMGMVTQNWDVELRLADGTVTRDGGQVIPFYACWIAAPGAEVPIVLDPKDQGKATVDWVAAAVEAADRAGGIDDPPPPGSVAETVAHSRL